MMDAQEVISSKNAKTVNRIRGRAEADAFPTRYRANTDSDSSFKYQVLIFKLKNQRLSLNFVRFLSGKTILARRRLRTAGQLMGRTGAVSGVAGRGTAEGLETNPPL